MAVKIRLMRIGTKKRPFYRVVAVDERKKRTGEYLELLGTYNPLTEPKELLLKQDRIDAWVKNGAQLSHGYLRTLGKAPQKPPRKPKKAQDEAPAEAAPAKLEAAQTDEATDEGAAETTEVAAETPSENVEETTQTPEESTAEAPAEAKE